VLFAAAQLADLMWPFLLAAGIEQVRIEPGITAFTPLDFVSYAVSLGPPPPSVTVLIVSAVLGAGLLLIWALWFDRHRTPIT
jgi:hypothetical protein